MPGARVLDVGCGFGSFLIQAKEAGYEVAGIEPDEDACAGACKVLGEGVVRQGTLHELSLPAGSADVVATLDVLEHVPAADQATFAALMADVLVPAALWLIKVPSTEGLYYTVVGPDGARRSGNRRHVHAAALADGLRVSAYRVLRPAVAADLVAPPRLHRDRHRYLPEVPIRTIIDRLTHDGDISRGPGVRHGPGGLHHQRHRMAARTVGCAGGAR